ncbi:MAG: HIT family protein [Chloroflexi bacterium]|nr:HIT family protein [Chloroflexota bacterium]
MHNGSRASLEANDCAFCQRSDLAHNILKETPAFLLVTDHAPLVEGHLLIIPRRHYACYGEVPAELDEELLALKREVQRFFVQYYAPAVFWEHGVFRQTVFHAHLHCFPFGDTKYDLAEGLHSLVVHSQEDKRLWYATRGQYFYMEDRSAALLFAPEMDCYLHIIRDVLWHGVSTRSHQAGWRSQQQRYEEGGPLIRATKEKWHAFLQQGAGYADETSAR